MSTQKLPFKISVKYAKIAIRNSHSIGVCNLKLFIGEWSWNTMCGDELSEALHWNFKR